MKALKLMALAAIGSLALGSAAYAQEDIDFSAYVGVSNDYVFRGFSQTDEDIQIFGGFDGSSGSGYAGVWASNVDFGDGTDTEYDLYVGLTPTFGPLETDLAVIYYGYAGAPSGSGYDYWEFKGAASTPAGPLTLGAAFYYSPDFFGVDDEALYVEANASVDIPASIVSFSGAIGHQSLDVTSDFTTWNIGASVALNDNIGFDLRYHDSNFDSPISDERFVVSVSAGF